MRRIGLFFVALLMASPAHPRCDAGGGAVDPADWDSLYDDITRMGELQRVDLVAGQEVWYLAPRYQTRALDSLRAITPNIEREASAAFSRTTRPVLLVESRQSIFGGTLAFTSCVPEGQAHWITDEVTGFEDLPGGACLIVTFPDKLPGDNLDFALAHEWMHTMQEGAYGEAVDGSDWWREGSADWFAHRVVPSFTARDPWIGRFFGRQPQCSLNVQSYDTQVFYFWGAEEFDSPWVFELGLGGEDYLRDTGRAAEILPPDRWLDWAKAQADGEITYPDGRDLPAGPEVQLLDFTENCKSRLLGPGLAVQIGQGNLSEGGDLTISTGGAEVALRMEEGPWQRINDGETLDLPRGQVTLAAISPSDATLDVGIEIGGASGEDCACYIGHWIEAPLFPSASGFHFRNDLDEWLSSYPGVRMRHINEGPWISIFADGKLTLDDPYRVWAVDFFEDTYVYQDVGMWTDTGGRLRFFHERRREHSFATLAGLSFRNIDNDLPSLTGSGNIHWIPRCEGDLLYLTRYSMDQNETVPTVTLMRR